MLKQPILGQNSGFIVPSMFQMLIFSVP